MQTTTPIMPAKNNHETSAVTDHTKAQATPTKNPKHTAAIIQETCIRLRDHLFIDIFTHQSTGVADSGTCAIPVSLHRARFGLSISYV